MKMRKRSNVYTILIVFLLLIQQIISGCTTTVSKDVQKEELIREDSHKEELVKRSYIRKKRAWSARSFTRINVFPVMNYRTLTPMLIPLNSG